MCRPAHVLENLKVAEKMPVPESEWKTLFEEG
jgi:hypothetical protein